MDIIIMFLIFVVCLLVNGFLASYASDIAKDKGYPQRKWFHICFWLGPITYIFVAAMPDKVMRNYLIQTNVLLGKMLDTSNHSSVEQDGVKKTSPENTGLQYPTGQDSKVMSDKPEPIKETVIGATEEKQESTDSSEKAESIKEAVVAKMQKKTPTEIIRYALRYDTDEGMLNYIDINMRVFPDNMRTEIKSIISSGSNMRPALSQWADAHSDD